MKIVAQNLPKRIFEDCVKEENELVVEAGEFFGKMCGSATMNWAKKRVITILILKKKRTSLFS